MKNRLHLIAITFLCTTIAIAKGRNTNFSLWNAKNNSATSLVTNPPTGNLSQTFCDGATISNIQVTGTNIKWYTAAIGGSLLPITTNLINNTSYYASQTVSGIESSTRLKVSVTINPNIVPTFQFQNVFCQGYTVPILPTTSSNGITGTWSPEVISTADPGTWTYTFTPTAGLCATTTTMSITIISNIEPTFNSIPPICEGSPPPTLPSMSLNGIYGTWVPPSINTNNVGTQAYTFTPGAGQCATTNFINISVVSSTSTATISANPSICLGQNATINFNGTPNATVIYNVNGGTNQTILLNANGNANLLANLTTTTTYSLVNVSLNGGCITNLTGSATINVSSPPVITPPYSPYTVCDENQDGYSSFDLSSLIPEIIIGQSGISGTFHETLIEAQLGINAIPLSFPYNNISPFSQILYVRVYNVNSGCFSICPIELNVNPSPISPILNNLTACDNDSNPNNGMTTFNLTTLNQAILAANPNCQDCVITYYTSQLQAQNGTNSIPNSTSYIGFNGQMIWYRIENSNGCFNVGNFELQTSSVFTINAPTAFNKCDSDASPNNGFTNFDLTTKDNEIKSGCTTCSVYYYPSYTDAINNTNIISNPNNYTNSVASVQSLGVRVVNTGGCIVNTILTIRVLPLPTPRTNPPALAPKCDNNLPGDMLEVFDLTVNEGYIANGDPNLTFHYFATQADASANQNELIPATTALVGGNVWIRVENNRVDYQGFNCYVLVMQPLTVNPLPTVVPLLAPYIACDDNADGITLFNLADPLLTAQVLGTTQLPTDYTVSYYLTAAGANPLTNTGEAPLPLSYTNTSSPTTQTIYIRVVKNASGCFNTGVLPLAVDLYATATGPQPFNQCDSYADPYDGVELIDLTTYAPAILNGQDPTIFLVSYYNSLADAQAGTNALTLAEAQAYQTDADTDTIWVKVENSSNSITPFCYAITTIEITVERNPNPIINTANNVTTIYVDFITNQVLIPLTLNSGVTNPSNYTFEWFEGTSTTPIPGATGPSYTVATASPTGATRDYTVKVTSNSPNACQTTSLSFSVIQSGQPVVPSGFHLNAFLDNNNNGIQDSGEVNVPFGQFHYQVNNTTHNVFSFSGTLHIPENNPSTLYSFGFTINSAFSNYFIVNPLNYTNVHISSTGGITNINFAISISSFTDLSITNLPLSEPIPGFNYQHMLLYSNNGLLSASGNINFIKDPAVTMVNVSEPSALINPNGFTYNFTNLPPLQTRTIIATMYVPVLPNVSLGQLLITSASINSTSGLDAIPSNNTSSSYQFVSGSYDPNDIVESHGRDILHSSFSSEDYLYYTIRFENTGNGNAVNISIDNLLDSKLDESTLEMVSSSHNYIMDRISNAVNWKFNNIQLPPSISNSNVGKGYVMYKIKPKTGYAVGDIIPNTAEIFFDTNPAVVTNTFENEFVSQLSIPEYSNNTIIVYPNPAKEQITVQLSPNNFIKQVKLVDMLGRIIMTKHYNSSNTTEILSLNEVENGTYLLEITTDNNQKATKKILVN